MAFYFSSVPGFRATTNSLLFRRARRIDGQRIGGEIFVAVDKRKLIAGAGMAGRIEGVGFADAGEGLLIRLKDIHGIGGGFVFGSKK